VARDVWVAPDLVELVDHDPGATMTLAGVPKQWVRDASGEWIESSRALPLREWPAWVRRKVRALVRRRSR
jgi:hypothetical protein